MEWRCTWCGKPHADDDPPCDNCGHNKFERAVEQLPPESTDGPTDPVWVCTECGRQHTKNSPPCTRCGNVDLEQRQPDWDDLDELGGTSYWDVLEPKYVAGYALVAVLGLVLVLAYAGVITLPGMGRPPIPDAPGEGEEVGHLSLSGVEAATVQALNEERAAAGVGPLANDSDLQWYASYINKRTVEAVDANGSAVTRQEFDRVTAYCDGQPIVQRYQVFPSGSVTDFETEATLADGLLDSWQGRDGVLESTQGSVGIDVHVGANDRIFVTVAVC